MASVIALHLDPLIYGVIQRVRPLTHNGTGLHVGDVSAEPSIGLQNIDKTNFRYIFKIHPYWVGFIAINSTTTNPEH
jgi:hypothetical protein